MRIQKQKIRKLFKLDSSAFKNTIISLNIPLVMKLTDNIEERNCPILGGHGLERCTVHVKSYDSVSL